jgi:[acyl-carrier-protein] S-malonyltransferase
LKPSFVAGHSLGEYSANVAAGTFRFGDAVAIVRRRGQYMQEAVPVGTGAMAAILGLDAEAVAEVCRDALKDVAARRGRESANMNGGGQVAIAGSAAAVARASDWPARGPPGRSPAGQRAVPLRVDEAGQFDSRRSCGRSTHSPRVPVVANVDAALKRDAPGAIEALVARVVSSQVGSRGAAPCVGRRHNVC